MENTPNGFTQTILPLQPKLRARALRLTGGNEAEAEDLVQDALVRAYRFWHTFTPGTGALQWSYTILRNTFHNRCEKANVRRRHLNQARHEAAHAVLSVDYTEAVEAAETAQRVREAVEQLPETFRQAVTLIDLEGLPAAEAAAKLGCPVDTARTRAYRGRQKLAKILAA